MNHQKETFETWDKLAGLYEEKFMDMDLYNETYDYLCDSSLRQQAKVLEIGCGPGNIAKYLLAKRPDFDILGIDTSPNMIELAAKNNPHSRFQVMDAREISQLHTQFDLIVCGFCLPYLSSAECQQLIDDAGRMLLPNGMLYLSFVEGDPDLSDYKSSGSGRVFFHYHRLDTILHYLESAHLNDIRTLKVNFKRSETEVEEHSILLARKNSKP